MADYEKMYEVLNSGIRMAMTELRLRNYGRVEDYLAAAQSDAEAILLGIYDDGESEESEKSNEA